MECSLLRDLLHVGSGVTVLCVFSTFSACYQLFVNVLWAILFFFVFLSVINALCVNHLVYLTLYMWCRCPTNVVCMLSEASVLRAC